MKRENTEINPMELIEMAKKGNQDALGRLYDMYYVPVFRYLYLRVGNKADTEDLTQTVFLKIFKSISSFKNQGKPPLTYFFTIARNTFIDHWRSNKKELSLGDLEEDFEIEIPDTEDGPEDSALKKENRRSLLKAIVLLAPDQQETITLKFINELSNKEIAELTGKNEAAIRQLQSRALKTLKDKIEK